MFALIMQSMLGSTVIFLTRYIGTIFIDAIFHLFGILWWLYQFCRELRTYLQYYLGRGSYTKKHTRGATAIEHNLLIRRRSPANSRVRLLQIDLNGASENFVLPLPHGLKVRGVIGSMCIRSVVYIIMRTRGSSEEDIVYLYLPDTLLRALP